ncbi:spermine/spermidine synthase domain-containing protein [Phytoactinopolyspora halotolerans]|uniref:Spermidine synthase n=1 Tax=Phytoactinopolyspora halotolerans TaxID=1981512 RepID=A0A6L9S5A2_9ACTN|nr:hypothetical protein [Phytoactinopolyspora halotolerans]NED99813.1 hypothetical protein [Phytoactinopolyspora halotolerans]
MDDLPETLARGDGIAGELALRRRGGQDGVYELIVNGTFLMDTAETSTERLLADVLLDRHDSPRRVLVGGLGFGFTVDTLLGDARVDRVDVVELEPLLVDWLRDGMVPAADVVMNDPRVHIEVADIRDALDDAAPELYDGILLDTDNGPGFLVRDENARVYEPPALRAAADALAVGGVLALWSAAPSDRLAVALADSVGDVTELVRTVTRQGREVDYHIYLAQRRPR